MALTHSSRLSFTRTIWHRLTTKSLLEGRHHEDMFLYVLLCSFVLSGKMWFSGWDWGGYHCVSYCTSLNERWRHGRKEPKPLPAIPRSHGHPMSSVQKTRPFLATKVSEAHCCATSAASSGKASKPKRTCSMARYGTVKLRNLRCLGRPLFSVPRCTILYHVVMHVVTFRRFETCQKTCWNMLKLWDLITTRSITEAAFLVTQLLPHQDRGKSVLHQHNVAIRLSEMRAEALKPWHHQNDAKSCHCATQPSNLMVWIQADLQGSRWQHGYPHAHITSYYRVP